MTPGHDIEISAGLASGDLKRELQQMESAVSKSMKKIGSEAANPRVDLNKKEFDKGYVEVKRMMDFLDRDVATGKVDLDTKEFDARYKMIQAKLALMERKKVRIKLDIDSDPALRAINKLERTWDGFTNRLKGDKGLLNTPVHFFNLTLKVRQLIGVIAILAPMIEGVIGAMGSLGAVTGAGVVGALAGATTALTSFIVGMGSAGIVAAGLVPSIKNTNREIGEYVETVNTAGRKSSEAAAQLTKVQRSMGGVSAATARTVSSAGQLWETWQKLVRPSRSEFWNTAAEGLRTVRSNMRLMAQEGNENFAVLSQGTRRWFRELRSDGAKNTLANLSGIFQATAPQIMASISNIVSAIAHIGVAAAPIFSRFTSWLQNWSDGWRKATGDTAGMAGTMDKISNAAASLGRFLGASGRLLWAVFKGGADAGGNLLDSISGIFDKWSQWLNTHPQQVHEWFSNANETASKLATAIGHIVQAFFQWSNMMRPVANVILNILNALLQFKGVAVTVAGVMAGMWAVSKIAKFIVFVNAARTALAGLRTAGATTGMMTMFGGKTGMGATLARIAPMAAPIAAVAAGVASLAAAAAYVSNAPWRGISKDIEQYTAAVNASNEASRELPGAFQGAANAITAVEQAREAYGKKRSQANLIQLDQAEAQAAEASATRQATAQKLVTASITQIAEARERLDKANALANRKAVSAGKGGSSDGRTPKVLAEQAAAAREYEFALDRAHRASLNMSRAQAGLTPILGNVGMKMGQTMKIADSFGTKMSKGFKNFTVRASYDQVSRASQAISGLKSKASQKTALNIVANTRNPETALRRVELLARSVTRAKRILRVDGDAKAATRTLSNVQLKALGLTRKRWNAIIGVKDETKSKMQSMSRFFGLTTKKRSVTIEAKGATQAQAQVQKLKGSMDALKPKSPNVSTPGVPSAYNAVTALKNQLNSLQDKTVTVRVKRVGGVGAKAGGGTVRVDERLTLLNERGAESATAPDGQYIPILGDGREGIMSLEPGTHVHTAAETRNLWQKLGIQAMAGGGKKKGSSKYTTQYLKNLAGRRTNKKFKKRPTIKKFRGSYGPAEDRFRNAQKKVSNRENLITQENRNYDLDSREFPSVDKDGNPIPGNIDRLQGKLRYIQGLITGLKGFYDDLEAAGLALIKQIDNWVKKWEKEKSRVQKDKKLTSGGRTNALSRISKVLGDLRDDRGDVKQAIGTDLSSARVNADQDFRSLGLDINDLEAIRNQVSPSSGGGDTSIADQATARASATERALKISEGAFNVFRGAGDIGSGAGSALSAALGSGNRIAGLMAPSGSSNAPAAASAPQQTVNVYSMVPGDSRSLRDVANAAASGFGGQGAIPSSRMALPI